MSQPLMNRRTQQPFRQYQASPSWLEEERVLVGDGYLRSEQLVRMKSRKDPLRQTLLVSGLIAVGIALALAVIMWLKP